MNSPVYAGTRELNNKTNELLRVAASGKRIIVTRYGEPVATL
jgi:prevent-host-death family protein